MKFFFKILTFIIALTSCVSVSVHQRVATKIMKRHVEYIREKFGAQISTFGGGFNQKVNNITLSFDMRGPMELQRARKLIIAFSTDLLDRINSSEEIRPYLVNHPFLPSNLSYGISFVDKTGEHMKNPGNSKSTNSLARCNISNGTVYYSIMNENKPYLQTVHSETYEEALEIVNSEGGIFLKD